ncbi:MAG: hypothetical protein D6681_14995, partial [Calditrichaeota bacterium]
MRLERDFFFRGGYIVCWGRGRGCSAKASAVGIATAAEEFDFQGRHFVAGAGLSVLVCPDAGTAGFRVGAQTAF